MVTTPRARALLSFTLSVLVLWTGMDLPGMALASILERATGGGDQRVAYVLASLIPLGLAVWALLLSRRNGLADEEDDTIRQVARVLSVLAVVVSALGLVATFMSVQPGAPFVFRFAG